MLIIQLESHILNQERPDIVTEPVCVKVALLNRPLDAFNPGRKAQAHLERKPSADFIRQHLGNNPIKGGEDLHGELGLDTAFVDEIVQRVGQRQAETGLSNSRQFLGSSCRE